jgi:hypothetical protein
VAVPLTVAALLEVSRVVTVALAAGMVKVSATVTAPARPAAWVLGMPVKVIAPVPAL